MGVFGASLGAFWELPGSSWELSGGLPGASSEPGSQEAFLEDQSIGLRRTNFYVGGARRSIKKSFTGVNPSVFESSISTSAGHVAKSPSRIDCLSPRLNRRAGGFAWRPVSGRGSLAAARPEAAIGPGTARNLSRGSVTGSGGSAFSDRAVSRGEACGQSSLCDHSLPFGHSRPCGHSRGLAQGRGAHAAAAECAERASTQSTAPLKPTGKVAPKLRHARSRTHGRFGVFVPEASWAAGSRGDGSGQGCP
jgi:hypothetical protein